MRNGDEERQIDARPSDAIALALRFDSPIWVMEEVIADASIPVNHEADEEEREEFRKFLADINPSDFTQHTEKPQNGD